jgi:serine-type D-Ala-D-Ala carboxypeptidase (penicillin-binding protein 5/6)
MKNKKATLVYLIFLLISLAVIVLVRYYNKKRPIISPTPTIAQITSSWKQEKNLWFPKEQPANLALNCLDVLAQSALVINLDNGQILYAKNAHQPLPIASLTKIMTALVALETAPLDAKMIVSHQAVQVGEATMNLSEKEKLTLEELLYGLILVSGNDAATAIAENIAGRVPLFTNLMNEKASQLNLYQTKFYNPHGLDQNGTPPNQSTTYELAILSYHALKKFPQLKKTAATDNITINASEDHKEYFLNNLLGLERTYPGLSGLKPGYTDSAGYCLVGIAKRETNEVMVILLNSPNLKEDLTKLLDYWLAK